MMLKKVAPQVSSANTDTTILPSPKIGERVRGNWKGRNRLYPGVVTAIHEVTDTRDILYDDGDRESYVPKHRLWIPIDDDDNNMDDQLWFIVDQRIVSNWKAKGRLYAGRITHVHENKHVDIAYDDGDVEFNVPPCRCRDEAIAVGTDTQVPSTYALYVGQQILGNWKSYGRYYQGKISFIHYKDDGNTAVDIAYDDGDREYNVPPNRVKIDRSTQVMEGQEVIMNCQGKGQLYVVKITKFNPEDGSVMEVEYSDGTKENPGYNCIWEKSIGEIRSTGVLTIGQPILHNWKLYNRFWPAYVHNINSMNQTVDVKHESDHTVEVNIPIDRLWWNDSAGYAAHMKIQTPSLLRLLPNPALKVGDAVISDWKGYGHLYTGKISEVMEEGGFYSVAYDDGTSERAISFSRVRDIQAGQFPQGPFMVDQQILSLFQGTTRVRPGNILHIHEQEKTVDVQFDHGVREDNIPMADIWDYRIFMNAPAGQPFDRRSTITTTISSDSGTTTTTNPTILHGNMEGALFLPNIPVVVEEDFRVDYHHNNNGDNNNNGGGDVFDGI
jgi:ribosomal protein L35AE/L33A